MKKAVRAVTRPRWLILLVLAAAVVPVALITSGGASAGKAGAAATNPAHPVVNANWIYANDWYDATHFIYKRAGSDGCLLRAPNCNTSGGGTQGDINNLPMNYNGTQEFNDWWANLGVSSGAGTQNGTLGRFMNRRDHFFNQASWQINVQELTIPGATCAGQQVMLAYHPDSQGVSAPNITTSSTPLSGMYSGSWGTGSAYDSNMGGVMNLEEIGSVLRWHAANGTYPMRTIESAVYDAELQGLVGSGDYSSAGTAAAIVTAPTSVGDTNIKVTSTSNLGVGATIALDEVNTENPVVQSVGTATTNTTLVGPVAVGATKIEVASVSGMAAGNVLKIDLGNVDTATVATVGTAQRTASSLSTAANVGDTNIKVASVTNMVLGERVAIDAGFSNVEYRTITAVGTAGSAGTGLTLDSGLSSAHASAATVQDLGSGITLSTAATFTHPTGGRVINTSSPGTGITLTAPLAKSHDYGSTVNGAASGLISDSPQGSIVGVLNNDQNGINYPALHWGTTHYLNDLVGGSVGPWFNNINATPVSAAANSIYGAVGIQRLQHNLSNVQTFRTNVANAVTQAMADLGQKYNFSIPIGNPDLFKNTGSVPDNPLPTTVPSYLPADQARYTPVQDDRTGRTDQVSFGVRGIPSLGNIGVYDGNTDPLVGGNENPYPTSYPSKPNISFLYGQDTMSDYFSNLNFFAGGVVHGPGNYDQPSEGLLRGVEFVATYFSYAVASPGLGGKVDMPNRPIAYFEQTPRKATATTTVSYDAGFSRTKDGLTSGLTYYWDFGDGSGLQKTTNPIITHTFPTKAGWYDVKLLVNNNDKWGAFRQVEPIDFFPTYYPALVPPTEPLPPTTGAAADPCGVLSSDELQTMIAAAKTAKHAPATTVTLKDLAAVALQPNSGD
jgi:hypothetical protein